MVYRKDPQTRRRNRWKSYLTYLVVASLALTGVSMSRYQTTVQGGDSARVATVAVGNNFSMQLGRDLKPGKTVDLAFTVSNQDRNRKLNEVLMEYTLELEHSLNLPLEYSLYSVQTASSGVTDGGSYRLAENTPELTDLYSVTRYTNTYTLQSYGAAAAEQYFVLRLTWPAAANSASYSDEIDYATIRVNAVQKDG